MDFREFQKTAAKPQPAYLLKTDQDYLKKRVLEFCKAQVAEGAREFDWCLFDLDENDEMEVVNAARTLPWMSQHRWLYVRNAGSSGKQLAGYLADPSPRSVVVLEVSGRLPKWPRMPRIEMPARISPQGWVAQRAKQAGYRVDPEAVRALVERIGDDFQALEAALDKLFLFCLESRRIDRDSVGSLILHSGNTDIFTLISAVASGDAGRALRVLNTLFDAGMAPPQILSLLYWNFRRLLVAREMLERRRNFAAIVKELRIFSYRGREKDVRSFSRRRLAAILFRLRETDLQTKSTSIDEKTLLERLIVDTSAGSSL